MIKIFFLILFTCFIGLWSCSRLTMNCTEKIHDSNSYKVVKIKKENNWYFIYLKRNDSIFKVVTQEPADKTEFEGYCKIKKQKKYNLCLFSYRDNLIINGIRVWNIGEICGLKLDSITEVTVEPENDIWDLYYSKDLKGLYYIEKTPTTTSAP